MATPRVPEAFLKANDYLSKGLVVTAEIEDVNDIFANQEFFTDIRYGDPIEYGDVGLVYGGKRPYSNQNGGTFQALINLEKSQLVLSQKIEQEQGRASISQMAICFTNKNGYFTNLAARGKVVNDLMGKIVTIRVGYTQLSFPDQYWQCFEARVQGFSFVGANFFLQLGDANLRRRRTLFFRGSSVLNGAISNSSQVIDVVSNSDFHRQILGPDGLDDANVKTYLQIEDEFIEYNRQAFLTNQFSNVPVGAIVTRGARGTIAVTHDSQTDVTAAVEISGNPFIIALKAMLSGWNGPYEEGVPVKSIVFTGDPVLGDVENSVTLDDETDANLDLGIAVGDWLTISGDEEPSNNVSAPVLSFFDVNGLPRRGMVLDTTLVRNDDSSAVFSIRSQYDTLPITCGLKMYGWEVDVSTHQDLADRVFGQELMRFFLTDSVQSGKNFIEMQLYLPLGAYSLTRFGRMSAGVALPPTANQRLKIFDQTNVINAPSISVERNTTNRNFFNQIDTTYDENDLGEFRQTFRVLDSESISEIEVLSVLPIQSRGTKSDLTPASLIQGRSERLLSRYSLGAVLMKFEVNFKVGITIMPGDTCLINDPDTLKLPNLVTGEQGLGQILIEVKEMSINFSTGKIAITCLSVLNYSSGEIFATWGPSSLVSASQSTASSIKVKSSYGSQDSEWTKWQDYEGMRIRVHSYDFSFDETVVLTNVTTGNILQVSPPLSAPPGEDYIVDLVQYSTDTDPNFEAFVKLQHVFWVRSAPVVSGLSTTSFTVSAPDAALILVGRTLRIHNEDFSDDSGNVEVISVVGTTVTVEDMGFTPAANDFVELVPWYDQRAPYLWSY